MTRQQAHRAFYDSLRGTETSRHVNDMLRAWEAGYAAAEEALADTTDAHDITADEIAAIRRAGGGALPVTVEPGPAWAAGPNGDG